MEPANPPDNYVYAATDHRARTAEERDLCETAREPDWLYLGALGLLNGAAIFYDHMVTAEPSNLGDPKAVADYQSDGQAAVRLTGASAVGLTWGGLVSGFYLALPKCHHNWVPSAPREGTVRANLPIALSLSALATATAPLFVAIETGPFSRLWGVPERSFRVIFPMVTGLIGSMLPYIPFLAPKTWRAALKLEDIRLQAAPIPPGEGGLPKDRGAWLGVSGRF